MWRFIYFVLSLFGRNRPSPILQKEALNYRYSFLQSKSILFVFLMLIIFTGGFLFDYFFSNQKNKEKELTVIKKYFSKVTLITLFLLLNFFINELHLVLYKSSDVYRHIPNNPRFYFIAFMILLFLFGFLIINSKLVPEQFHLNYKFWDAKGIGGKISAGLIAFNVLWALLNILINPNEMFSYLLLLSGCITSLVLNRKVVNIWIVYGIISLFMINNLEYVINIDISPAWIYGHYIVYAFQLAMMFFGLIKLENFNFFENNTESE